MEFEWKAQVTSKIEIERRKILKQVHSGKVTFALLTREQLSNSEYLNKIGKRQRIVATIAILIPVALLRATCFI